MVDVIFDKGQQSTQHLSVTIAACNRHGAQLPPKSIMHGVCVVTCALLMSFSCGLEGRLSCTHQQHNRHAEHVLQQQSGLPM